MSWSPKRPEHVLTFWGSINEAPSKIDQLKREKVENHHKRKQNGEKETIQREGALESHQKPKS